MAIDIGRRKFISALGGTVAISSLPLPHAARAEKADRLRRIGVLMDTPESDPLGQSRISAFLQELQKLGWEEGRNLKIELRWSGGDASRIKDYTAELVRLAPDVIVANGSPVVAAMEQATRSIPIVFVVVTDPVEQGFIPSLAHPGGNLTGLSLGWSEGIAGKWLELLQEMVPQVATVAVLMDPDRRISREQAKRLEAIAPTRHLKVHIIAVRGPEALDGAFEQAARTAQAVLVMDDPNLSTQRTRIVALAAKYRLANMHVMREYVDAGGLMAYVADVPAMFGRAADYVDKILKGTKPADLPIEEPTKYVLIVNLKTAKALGITIPESILLRADEVIR